MPQGFASHNLVGVAEAKPGCGHIPGFSDVGKLLTLTNVDGDLASLSVMLHVLTALILGTLPNAELLQGGIQYFGKTLGVQAVAANPDSCHPWWVVVQGRLEEKLAQGRELSELRMHRMMVPNG
jgi:hypothetical protein